MKTELTKKIEKDLFHYTKAGSPGVYGCYEVCLGSGYGDEFVDFMTMDSKDVFRCYEIKISLSDFSSSNKLSFAGDFNYLVIPQDLLKEISDTETFKKLVLQGIGLLLFDENKSLFNCERKPKDKKIALSRKVDLMHCMVRSLSRYCKPEGD